MVPSHVLTRQFKSSVIFGKLSFKKQMQNKNQVLKSEEDHKQVHTSLISQTNKTQNKQTQIQTPFTNCTVPDVNESPAAKKLAEEALEDISYVLRSITQQQTELYISALHIRSKIYFKEDSVEQSLTDLDLAIKLRANPMLYFARAQVLEGLATSKRR